MKKVITLAMLALSLSASAQDTYLNNTVIGTSDVFGTSRFVAMGGAMGALGADVSTISSNPAGLGMFTKNEVTVTAGAAWMGKNTASNYTSGAYAKFDQMGIITTFRGSGNVRTVNFGFNYQKKADYNNSFYGATLSSASWADQLDGLAGEAFDNRGYLYGNPDTYFNTLYGLADAVGLFQDNIVKTPNDENSTLHVTRGALNAFDFNISTNISNRVFLGITLGIDNVDFSKSTDYWEQRTDNLGQIQDFGYVNEQVITGNGFNFKFGAIIRPLESSSFRLGFTVETPTWYKLKYIDDQSLSTKYAWNEKQDILEYDYSPGVYHTYYVYDLSDSYINYLEYSITTPWKVRAQMGSTMGTNFAWGAEYEFCHYPGTTMKFPSAYGGTTTDADFNDMTARQLQSQHALRLGVEYKPISALSLRAGYNFITSTTKSDSFWDPYFADCSLSYPTGLDYMNLSDTNILTLGLGYRSKYFFADLAYKYRHQTGEYYAFDSYYSNVDMASIPVNLSTHSITATVGVRF